MNPCSCGRSCDVLTRTRWNHLAVPHGAVVDGKALVDLRFIDKGYGEWYKHHWLKQVAAYAPKKTLPKPEPKPPVFKSLFSFLDCAAPRKPMQQELV